MAYEQLQWKMILILSALIMYFFGILSTIFHNLSHFNSVQLIDFSLKTKNKNVLNNTVVQFELIRSCVHIKFLKLCNE